jgi:hypothetical protein
LVVGSDVFLLGIDVTHDIGIIQAVLAYGTFPVMVRSTAGSGHLAVSITMRYVIANHVLTHCFDSSKAPAACWQVAHYLISGQKETAPAANRGGEVRGLAPTRQGTTPGFEAALPPVLANDAFMIRLISVTFRTRD